MPNINLNYKMVTDIKNNFFTNNRFIAAESLPAEGDFVKGDLIVNIGENANDEAMWLCVESGNPGVWEVVGAGAGGNTSGGGSSKIVTLKSRVTINNALSEVNIGVSGFNKATDTLMVFNNTRFMVEGVDYEINADSTKIVAMNGNVWNEELANDYVFDFVVFKMMNVNENGDVVVSSANEIVKLKNTVVVNEAVNEVEIGIDGFNEGDDLTVYRNSVYMIEGLDYEVQGNKIVSLKGAWNAEGGSDYKFTFEVLKAVAKVNPDAVIGMEHLTEDVKEAIEAAGNIDLSGKQDKTDNGLVTTDKTIVGAINELFQDVDSGKGIIADAIDDRNISKDSTFAAMGEAIEGIHADREEDRQKLIDILIGSNMELSGNESMDTLLDLLDTSNIDLSKVIQIVCGGYHTMLVKTDGSLWACGENQYGQLGLGSDIDKTTFTQVTTNINNDVKEVACGAYHTFIIKNDGSVWATGRNNYYQLGISDKTDKKTFTQVTTNINNDVKQIACGLYNTILLKNDGSLWATGYNYYGNLGLGDVTNRNKFTQVTTNINNDVKQISCSMSAYTLIVKNDGSLWACGNNSRGQLGLNDTTDRKTFTKVTTNINNDVKEVACGGGHTIIVKNDGSLWSTGLNNVGQLGIGTSGANTDRSKFIQVTTNINNDVDKVYCGGRYTIILKNDGSVWSCGDNGYGQLGLGDTNARTTFTQITTNINNDVKQIACGGLAENLFGGHTVILKNDGNLWACGMNTAGQLGLSDIANRTTFTLVDETEALRTQVQLLNTELTMNRGNLATVLTDEGVELTGDETLADLIVKTDEEFDDKKNEIENIRSTIVNILENKGVEVNPEDGLDSILDNISNIKRSAYPDWYSEGDAWINATDVPVYIYSSPAAVVDENIYLMGGRTGTTSLSSSVKTSSTIYKYNTKNNTWETKSSMPAAKYGAIAEAVDGKVYCIGGYSSNKTNYCYDPITDSCTTKTAMTAGKRQSASSTVNGKIYVIAGYTTALVKTNYCYDTTTNTWTTKAAAPNSFRSAAAVSVNDKIYVIGGVGSDERFDAMNTNYCYDTTTNTWTTKAAITNSNYVLDRFGHGACYYKNKIYAFGGHGSNTYGINTGYVYDVSANTWSAMTALDMPLSAGYYSYVLVGNTYYMFGGEYFSSSGSQVQTNYRKLSRCFVLKL